MHSGDCESSVKIAAIVLTHNEEMHIARCLCSLRNVVSNIVIVDSFSSDSTVMIAQQLSVRILQNVWVNYATQFNWGLSQLDSDTEWVLRLDADEWITPELETQIALRLPRVSPDVDGVYIERRLKFQGRLIRYGGVGHLKVLRLFRYGRGHCENRWMDEHIRVVGPTIDFEGGIIDDRLGTLTKWSDKHNEYASREAIDLLNLRYNFLPRDSVAKLLGSRSAQRKRWIKEEIYSRLPLGLRAVMYFLYRFFIRFGFLDGSEGRAFHFLQGFWYRFLVDAKVREVQRYMRTTDVGIRRAVEHVLGIRVDSGGH